ncbi:MAG: hypothetical protein J6P71_03370, partial [Oscillospiraceae bacterium]|nr:hypothetical protein [Oscillospiraceae bacterium]
MRQRKKDIFAPSSVENARDPAVRIPALFASPGGKNLSFCVQSSFERAIFRSDKIKTAGNTGYVFPAVFVKYGRKKGHSKPVVSSCESAQAAAFAFHLIPRRGSGRRGGR